MSETVNDSEWVPFEGVLCTEGERTNDGRVIAPGALVWALPIPITDLRNGIVGRIEEIEREENEIHCRGQMLAPLANEPLAIEVKVDEYEIETPDGVIRDFAAWDAFRDDLTFSLTAGTIQSVACVRRPAFTSAKVTKT